ncbi:MAG: type II secretion system F family protein [Gemmatimonas sp.]
MIGPQDILPILIFAAVLTVVLLVVAFLPGGGKRAKRAEKIASRFGARKRVETSGPSLLTDAAAPGLMGQIERALLQAMPRPAALRLKLARAGVAASPGRFATVAALVGIVAAAATIAMEQSAALALPIGIAAALGLPNLWLSWRIGRRQRKFVALFPEAVELMVRGLKSGVPVTQTISSVGHEIQDPVGAEFRHVADSAALGVSLIDALWESVRRVDVAEFRFFVVALTIQRETGGNLAETLENLADILRKRLQMRLKVKALSSEARSSATIIGVLPFAMFGILMALNRDYAMKLVEDPRGEMMLGGGLFMMLLGIAVMAKMVKFEV